MHYAQIKNDQKHIVPRCHFTHRTKLCKERKGQPSLAAIFRKSIAIVPIVKPYANQSLATEKTYTNQSLAAVNMHQTITQPITLIEGVVGGVQGGVM